MVKRYTRHTCIRIDEDLKERIESLAKDLQIPRSAVIRRLLRRALEAGEV